MKSIVEICRSLVGFGTSLGQKRDHSNPDLSKPPSDLWGATSSRQMHVCLMLCSKRRGRGSFVWAQECEIYGQTTDSWLRIAELAKPLASALCSRGTWEMEKSKERASLRQIQFKEYKRGLRQL
jgi:hypothetical protein